MAEDLEPLDVSDRPELLRLAEEIRSTNTPRILKRGDEALVRVLPVSRTRVARPRARANYEAFRSSAGGWKDVDTDKLIEDIYRDRLLSDRPAIDL